MCLCVCVCVCVLWGGGGGGVVVGGWGGGGAATPLFSPVTADPPKRYSRNYGRGQTGGGCQSQSRKVETDLSR